MNDWLTNEIAHYRILLCQDTTRSAEVGTMRMGVLNEGETIMISTKIVTLSGEYTSRLRVQRKTLAPILVDSETESPAGYVQVKGEYSRTRLSVRTISDRSKQQRTMEIPENCFDNGSAFYVIRGIVVGALKLNRINLVNANVGVSATAEVEVTKGEATVTVPYGAFHCVVVRLRFPGALPLPEQRFYFGKREPYLMAKNVVGPQLIELVSFETASGVASL